PVFVTVRVTRNVRPVHTCAERMFTAATRLAGVWISTVLDTVGAALIANPEFSSAAVTVVVQLTSPGTVPVYVHVKVCDAPPARSNGSAGVGPNVYVTPPAPVNRKAEASTPTAVACPV